MNQTTGKLLRAACDIAGSRKALADKLGIRERVLSLYLDHGRELPGSLLLQVVDIILTDREARFPAESPAGAMGATVGERAYALEPQSVPGEGRLPESPENRQNSGGDNSSNPSAGTAS
jgi:hypothetical protein